MNIPIEFRLPYFREMIQCAQNLYSWTLNYRFEPIYTNCPNQGFFERILSVGHTTKIVEYTDFNHNVPLISTNSLGLVWIVEIEIGIEPEKTLFHLVGPAFYDSVTHQTLEEVMDSQQFSVALKNQFMSVLDTIPVVSLARMMEYALMLHYTLTGEKITNSELQFFSSNSTIKHSIQPKKYHGTWASEQALLKLVEDGNLDYMSVRNKFNLAGNVGKLVTDNPIRQVKNQIIIYTALSTRAAIRGGLSPETAYTLSDQYIQMVEAADSVPELAEISRDMQDDFIRRVHRAKTETGVSKSIQACRDYIHLHYTEKISLGELAQMTNYSVNYLSKKFSKEIGVTIMDYVTHCRIERAKELLISSPDTIQEISEFLGFGTQSYFGAQFKKLTGMPAGEYRSKYGKNSMQGGSYETDI